jgi:hypothetical protein
LCQNYVTPAPQGLQDHQAAESNHCISSGAAQRESVLHHHHAQNPSPENQSIYLEGSAANRGLLDHTSGASRNDNFKGRFELFSFIMTDLDRN